MKRINYILIRSKHKTSYLTTYAIVTNCMKCSCMKCSATHKLHNNGTLAILSDLSTRRNLESQQLKQRVSLISSLALSASSISNKKI